MDLGRGETEGRVGEMDGDRWRQRDRDRYAERDRKTERRRDREMRIGQRGKMKWERQGYGDRYRGR